MRVALGQTQAPSFSNPSLAILQERGLEFERAFLKHLRDQGLSIVEPAMQGESLSVERTVEAIKTGVDVIYQANFNMEPWQGRADFLLKVPVPSNLGDWSYEVADTKLAKETRSGTILQISLYSQMINNIQGRNPEYMHVITPTDGFEKETYRVTDFDAYTRLLQARLLKDLELGKTQNNTYPNPVPQCDICNWWQECSNQRRKDDHLSLVAGLSRGHTAELIRQQLDTVDALAKETIPIAWRPLKGAAGTYNKLREQARVQVSARKEKKPIYELLELQANIGLHRLPEPSKGDIFFDFEGDPYVGKSGIEYLFGWTFVQNDQEQYRSIWSVDANSEKAAFESFVDWVIERWEQHPEFHIYHYTPYEPSALKRLMGKYATRENEIDRMLRGGLFVDLYSISRQSVRAGIETYSLKELEIFHGFERKMPLREAALHMRAFERMLESGNVSEIPHIIETAIALYNKEDCQSTSSLRNWLESLRFKLIDNGAVIPRPEPPVAEPGENLTFFQESIRPLYEGLMAGLDADPSKRNAGEQGRWLLANMLDWYRREKKALWWEFFRILALPEDELLEEKSALGGIKFTGSRRPEMKSIVDTYSFPDQDCDIRIGDKVTAIETGKPLGEVMNMDFERHTIELKKGEKNKDIHPAGIFLHNIIDDKVKEASITRIAKWCLENGIDADGDYWAGRGLLLGYNPRTIGNLNRSLNPQQLAVDWVTKLDQTVLPIQGPPGAGKSHTAATMILELIAAGKKVGVTALSHKVITGLLEKVMNAAAGRGQIITCIQKISNPNPTLPDSIQGEQKSDVILGALQNGQVQIVGGTSWLWAREEFASSVDVLFVDEAGQLSLVDTVAVSQAATNLVLLGDPQQLKQPQQGSHPEGTEVSALEHILGDQKTIPADRGIFLDVTWRMHPDVCRFVSELFYENRLNSKSGLENQRILGTTKLQGAGLWYVAVDHVGNQSWSMEEVREVDMIARQLCNGQVEWRNEKLEKRTLNESDIKVISPYNAQVSKLAATLPEGIQVGTVDKFQGQEAPVIIFSMASSTPEDAPRGMEFLHSLNRLNVAVSRAKAICILVASPKLFEPDCKNPAQMKLANAFCRYLELAK
jgi:predicted RecB family nuclease